MPNRGDVYSRALNANAVQHIDNDEAGARIEQDLSAKDCLLMSYQFIGQSVDAFQLVAGQNPDTRTKSHRARLTWLRQWSPATSIAVSAGFDRVGSLLVPDEGAVGPMVSTAGLTTHGPTGNIPINRAQNIYRYSGQWQQTRGRHKWIAGGAVARRQFNGIETDTHRIAAHLWVPRGAQGTAVVIHGYYDHTGLYGHLFRHLIDRGLAVPRGPAQRYWLLAPAPLAQAGRAVVLPLLRLATPTLLLAGELPPVAALATPEPPPPAAGGDAPDIYPVQVGCGEFSGCRGRRPRSGYRSARARTRRPGRGANRCTVGQKRRQPPCGRRVRPGARGGRGLVPTSGSMWSA